MGRLYIIAICIVFAGVAKAGKPQNGDSNFVCSEQGRYIDNEDTSCRRYHLCSAGNGGKWVRSSYNCPDGTIFDSSIGHCSSSANCGGKDSSDSSDSSSSDFDGDEFECKKSGLHDDTKDPYCSKYYECKENRKGALFAVQFPCPPPSKYDPVAKHCSHHYVCPRHFECTREGRFEDGNDENNKRYYLCIWNKKTKGYSSSVFSCPLYSRFVPDYELCDVPEESASDELDIHDHNLPVENWDNLDSFSCRARGYSANKGDRNSRSFYFCDVMADGKFVKYILACPRYYFWSSATNLCTPGR